MSQHPPGGPDSRAALDSDATLDAVTPPDYLATVERHFGLRRGGRMVLSPRDWQLVQQWQARDVPLEVVLRGINRAFDLFAAGTARRQAINSLAYCRQHVEEALAAYTERIAATGGSAPPSPLAPATRHLSAAADACDAAATGALATALHETAAALRALAARAANDDATVATIDEAAAALERELAARAEALGETPPSLPRFSPWQV